MLRTAAWILALILINTAIWKKGIRQYVAMGD
jgi:ABC-type uncharacterized transport system permease subunit